MRKTDVERDDAIYKERGFRGKKNEGMDEKRHGGKREEVKVKGLSSTAGRSKAKRERESRTAA